MQTHALVVALIQGGVDKNGALVPSHAEAFVRAVQAGDDLTPLQHLLVIAQRVRAGLPKLADALLDVLHRAIAPFVAARANEATALKQRALAVKPVVTSPAESVDKSQSHVGASLKRRN
jgi:hypothetical protein